MKFCVIFLCYVYSGTYYFVNPPSHTHRHTHVTKCNRVNAILGHTVFCAKTLTLGLDKEHYKKKIKLCKKQAVNTYMRMHSFIS